MDCKSVKNTYDRLPQDGSVHQGVQDGSVHEEVQDHSMHQEVQDRSVHHDEPQQP